MSILLTKISQAQSKQERETQDLSRGSATPQRCPTPRCGAHKGLGLFNPNPPKPDHQGQWIPERDYKLLGVVHKFGDSQETSNRLETRPLIKSSSLYCNLRLLLWCISGLKVA